MSATNAELVVVAVSRSQPETHSIHSQPTRTAIVRSPSTTPLVFSVENGIEGHQSAIHDAQVYAFFAHHYDYWTGRLNIDRTTWDWAFWGENLTIRSSGHEPLDETKVHLGDRWLFSSQGAEMHSKGVVLEVCGGRNPCSRLAWRCGQSPKWLAEVAMSGFCGVYLRVIRGGTIAPGDTATVIPTGHEDAVPAASIAQCAFSPLDDPATRVLAERILCVPGLQNMNKLVIARKLSLIQDKEAEKLGRWAGWRALEIVKTVDESSDVKSFYLAATDDIPLASYVPGQFLTVKLPSGHIRCWSISSWTPSSTTSPPPLYRITVRKGFGASIYLHSKCSVGDHLLVRSPSGSFVPDWSREFPPRQIYISAGIGVTPILCMLQAHFSHTTLRRTPAVLIHVARNSDEDFLQHKSELASSPLLRIIKFYSLPIADVDIQGQHYHHRGRPTADFFAGLFSESYQIDPLQITPIELPGHASGAYICGPPIFVDSTRGHLEAAKVPPHAIRSETFYSDPSTLADLSTDVDEDVPEESVVTFCRKSTEARWKKAEGLSLLQLAEREQLKPEYGCRVGDCGACEMRIVKGKARVLKSASEEAQEANGNAGTMIRACCSVPASAFLELDF
ncbi:PK beta-barrel-protein domain-containing protein-like protein [Byssothecium circinans]|uniref:PK beta-barrel-protein domain-containing protein-like protein n=1 Tax=Byssothecium circinans TaxID=147558 RepID=A0A6A5TC54_9PLEO|nr:PK beta-barrel-protein domain-containing protein-like protein [Byssothecium circinans]